MAEGKRITVEDMELPEVAEALPAVTLREAREAIEREMVKRTLDRHSGKISAAAAELGISRPTLYELMEKLGIAKE
jgi:two-component system NtrC family response regulator